MPASEHYHDNLEPFESALHRIISAEANAKKAEETEVTKTIGESSNIVLRPDTDTGQVIAYLKLTEFVPTEFRYLVTSIVSDLRHALDDAMCDAAVQLGRANPKGVYFPISHTPSEFERQIKEKCRGVDPALLDFVRSLEPYKRGKNELIWALSKFAGRGKHSRVLLMLPTVSEVSIRHGCRFVGYRPKPYPDENNEIAVAIGDAESDLVMTVTIKIEVNTEGLETTFQCIVEPTDFVRMTKDIVLGLKAETERLLSLRG